MMPSAYDDIIDGVVAQPSKQEGGSVYDDLFPELPPDTPLIGHQLPRWDTRRTGGPPSLSGAIGTFFRELAAQSGNLDRGVQQLFNYLPLGSEEDRAASAAKLEQEQAASDASVAENREAHPVATALARGAPYAVMPQRILPSIVLSTLYEALKYGSPAERATAGVGGAVSGGLSTLGGAVGRAAIQPTRGGPTAPGYEGAAARLGAPLTAGQRSLDPRTLAYEDYLRRTPFGSIPFEHINEAQRLAVNKAAARSIGETSDRLTQEVLASADDRIGGIFDDVTSRNSLQKSPPLFREVVDFRNRLASETTEDIRKVMMAQLGKYEEELLKHQGQIPGPVFRQLGTSLNSIVKSGGDLGRWARVLRDIMRRGMGKSISQADSDLWKQANEQYRNLMRLTEQKYTVNESTGDVSAKGVASVLEGEGKAQKMGRVPGPLGDVATFGRGLPSTAVGSQTASRQLWSELRKHPLQALTGIPLEYLPASILARGGLFRLHPLAQQMVSPTLGYLGKTTLPAIPQGLLD